MIAPEGAPTDVAFGYHGVGAALAAIFWYCNDASIAPEGDPTNVAFSYHDVGAALAAIFSHP